MICGLVWNESADQLSVTVKIKLALFFGRLKDGVGNRYMYCILTSLKGVWNKSWLIRKNKIVEVQDKNEAVNFCWTNITVILTCCVLARFPFARVLISIWMLIVVCQRCASLVLFSFLSFHESIAVSKSVDIGNSKMCNRCFVLTSGSHFCYRKLASTFLKHKLQCILSVSLCACGNTSHRSVFRENVLTSSF